MARDPLLYSNWGGWSPAPDWREEEARRQLAAGNYTEGERKSSDVAGIARTAWGLAKPVLGLMPGSMFQQDTINAAKGVAHSLGDMATLPGDVYAGKVDPRSPEGLRRSMNFSLTLPGAAAVPMSIAGRAESGALGMLAPVKPVVRSGSRLAPALRKPDGTVLSGGQTHADVAVENNFFPESRSDRGWVTPDGKFLDDHAAGEFLAQTEPVAASFLKKSGAAQPWGKLESNDLNRARVGSKHPAPFSPAAAMESNLYRYAPPLEGLTKRAEIPGQGLVEVAPFGPARDAALSYMEKTGLPYDPPRRHFPIELDKARAVADEFEKMKHDPTNPEVAAAYDALINETMAQFDEIKKTGLKIDFIKPGMEDPYKASPRLVHEDIKNNNHMWVYPTDSGFGKEGFDPAGNPLLRDTGMEIGGQKLKANDVFRIVHDYFGHVKEGVGFRASGEDNAFRQHRAMFSPLAQKALATETRGQNSWLNFGPHGEKNRAAKTEDTVFADQKIGLLPDWAVLYANSKKAAPLSLVPTIKRPDGQVVYGEPGMNHSDIFSKIIGEFPQWYQRDNWDEGFALGPGQPHMTRNQALNYVEANQPDVAANLWRPREKFKGKKELEATDYAYNAKKAGLYANNENAAPLSIAASMDDVFPFDRPTLSNVGPAVDDVADTFGKKYGEPTVLGFDPKDIARPELYSDPRKIIEMVKTAPESEWLKKLFGVTRDDLYNISQGGTRKGNMSPVLQFPARGAGKNATNLMTDANAQRMIDVLAEAGKRPDIYKGMDAWYVQDPLFWKFVDEFGLEQGVKEFKEYNMFTTAHSPGTPVDKEITRGTLARMLHKQGRGEDWLDYGGTPGASYSNIRDIVRGAADAGHMYHGTMAGPNSMLAGLIREGEFKPKPDAMKVNVYEMASGVPETGFQTSVAVPDSHFSRGTGRPDVMPGLATRDTNMKTNEGAPFTKWFRERVAEPLGLEAVPTQGRMWGALSNITGVKTAIGKTKLEIFVDNILRRAKETKKTPEEVLRGVIRGTEFAANPKELAPFSLAVDARQDR